MSVHREDLLKLLQVLDITAVDEIDCSEFLQRVGGFLERVQADGSVPRGHEQVVRHLRLCPECLEEYEAMYRALREDVA